MDGFNQNNTNHPASIPTTRASSSSRRRLTKKPPSSHSSYSYHQQHHLHHSSNSVDASAAGRFDALSIQSKRSSTSLRRVPSAPPARTTPARTPTSNNASSSSSPRHPPASSFAAAHHPNPRSLNPSPVISGAEFSSGLSFSHHPPSASANASRDPARSRDHYRLSDPHSNNLNHGTGTAAATHHRLNSRASEEFIGAPFDGSAILSRIEATKSPTSPHRPPISRLAHTTPDTRVAGLSLRQSASFSAAADTMAASEKSQGYKASDNQLSQSKRFSDESKEPKMSVLRKKSGFSGFMTSLVGSPKKPTISAPENPVHVTHVGYDSSTGQFTVSLPLFSSLRPSFTTVTSGCWLTSHALLIGAAQGMATTHQRERYPRKGQTGESSDARRRAYLLQGDD